MHKCVRCFETTNKGMDAGAIARALRVFAKLVADTPEDEVNGYVSTHGNTAEIHFYEADEGPGTAHKSTFKRKETVPSRQQAEAALA